MVDRRRRAEPKYGLEIRFVPAPRGHDFESGFEALAAIGRRSIARDLATNAERKNP